MSAWRGRKNCSRRDAVADFVTIYEVGPRDGLQNEARLIPTPQKVELINLLSRCGFRKIEVTSFVSAKWVPQMADAAQVMEGILRYPGTAYAALTPNLQGLGAAIKACADEVAIFASASEAFSQKNINCSIAESLARFTPVLAAAAEHGLPVRGYVSTITDCPWSGPVKPDQVAAVADELLRLGCYQVSLGDTIGAATPEKMDALLKVLLNRMPVTALAGHFHDTQGRALDNIALCLSRGLRTFDASVAGLGGCPFAPGAKGNVATEAVCALMARSGFETGIDMEALRLASRYAQSVVG
jgi:hydroxymethylglutaryl-CoA lyase